MNCLALTGATLYVSPQEDPIEDGVVVIRGDMIAAVGSRGAIAIPDDAETIDCSGRVITAGFWNCHVHFFERKWANAHEIPAEDLSRQLNEYTRFGFTSVFDLGSPWENTCAIRKRIDSGDVAGPQIRSTGPGLVPPGAIPSDTVLSVMGVTPFPAPEIRTGKDAARAAKQLLARGADGIKLFMSSPRSDALSEKIVRAATEEAHAAAKPAFAHPNSSADVLAAVRGGVDVVAHTTPHSGPWSDDVLGAMLEHRVALTPTLFLWKDFARHDRVSTQERIANIAVDQLRTWFQAGGTVLFGTDVGAVGHDPREEYALMLRAGMRLDGILDSLTTAPAQCFAGSEATGEIARGYRADLTVLASDPAIDIGALADVLYTIREGRIIHRPVKPSQSR